MVRCRATTRRRRWLPAEAHFVSIVPAIKPTIVLKALVLGGACGRPRAVPRLREISAWIKAGAALLSKAGYCASLIPTLIDQNSCAHLRMPSEMMRHGLSIRVFQA